MNTLSLSVLDIPQPKSQISYSMGTGVNINYLANAGSSPDYTIKAINDHVFFSTASIAISGQASTFGPGSGPIHFDDLSCSGTEDSLFSCPSASIDNCDHSEDAAIRCQPNSK